MQKIALTTRGNVHTNDMRELLMAFFPYGTIQPDEGEGSMLRFDAGEEQGRIQMSLQNEDGPLYQKICQIHPGDHQRQRTKQAAYDLLSEGTGLHLKWGTLTGIRPVRIAHEALVKDPDVGALKNCLKEAYRVSDAAADQMIRIAQGEVEHLYPLGANKVQIYINIPFCPTRCSYCSFITQEAGTSKALLEGYLTALKVEMALIGEHLKEKNWDVESVYVGGGTPTVLEPEQIKELLIGMHEHFPMNHLKEFTFEAGRPDTITREKLEILKSYGVDRISVNPQTIHDQTLKRLGRGHDVATFLHAYQIAVEVGFTTINSDLILGLEGERGEDMIESGKALIKLAPENITVHSLFLKNASTLAANREVLAQNQPAMEREATEAADEIYQLLEKAGYHPYYLYRQKYCVNNGENLGFAKPGHEGFYNMAMMSDKRTVLGVGAGATGKIYDVHTKRCHRMETVKNVAMYINRVDEIGQQKIANLWLTQNA